jgi:hypothetical protein
MPNICPIIYCQALDLPSDVYLWRSHIIAKIDLKFKILDIIIYHQNLIYFPIKVLFCLFQKIYSISGW